MIDKQYGKWVLLCDECGIDAEERCDTWTDAAVLATRLGWNNRIGSRWRDICPECRELERGEK